MIKQKELKWEQPSEVLPGLEQAVNNDFALVGETEAEWKERAKAIEAEHRRRSSELSERRQIRMFA